MTLPFYGATDRRSFAIERAAMDRPAKVITAIDALLEPTGTVFDIGAGDGFTAELLATEARIVVAVEPALGMIDRSKCIPWVRGVAQALPFQDHIADGAYATWACFFPGVHDISRGLAEMQRVVRPGGPIVIVDNAGADEFTEIAGTNIATDLEYWDGEGFTVEIIETAFVFESMADAKHLLTLYFGDSVEPQLEIGYRVAVMSKTALDHGE